MARRPFDVRSRPRVSERARAGKGPPKVLLISTSPSFSPARLAMALAASGCIPEAVCPRRHPLRRTTAVRNVHTYHPLAPLPSIVKAIERTEPHFVIPGDDLSASHLHDLYVRFRGKEDSTIAELVERSLGAPASFPTLYARTAFLHSARAEGIRVPRTEVISGLEDLRRWSATAGFPSVLKADRTSGGDGVKIVHNLEEAELAFRSLSSPPLLAKALKRAFLDEDMALLWPSLRRRPYVVNAQAFVVGQEATSAVACWKGQSLASVQFLVLNKQDAGGPSTVLRLIENPEMSAAAERVARRFALSGLHGFDFILEANTGNPFLIEINPRATQVGHLALGPGHDLPAALRAAWTGESLLERKKVTDKDTIALFPQEWLKNPASAFLTSGYHDVPWEEPDLVLAGVESWKKLSAWYSPQKWIHRFLRSGNPQASTKQ